jgi:hypothetical protein
MKRARSIPTSDLIAEALRIVPDLDELEAHLDERPDALVAGAL